MTRTRALSAVVLIHLAISLVHGGAHTGAQVPLPLAGTLFVYIVILAGPLVGLAASAWSPRAGALIVAVSMAGALIFGLVNHFIISGADHVAHVAAEWRTLFGTTAALLVVSEAVGVAVAVRQLRPASRAGARRAVVRGEPHTQERTS
jgi:F0F1-type ATP synthase membrane subunit a